MKITDRLESSSFKFNNITIGSLNLQGGFTTKAKMKEFKSITDKCHIFGLQEIWLENRESIYMSGFEHFRSERVRGRKARPNSGGVLLFYRSAIAGGVERQTSSNKHFIWVRLDAKFFKLNKDIFLCCTYIPPSNSKYFKNGENELLDLLQNDTETYNSSGNIIIIGDLNSMIGEKQEEINFADDTGDDHNILQHVDIPIRKALDVKSNSSGRNLLYLMNERCISWPSVVGN